MLNYFIYFIQRKRKEKDDKLLYLDIASIIVLNFWVILAVFLGILDLLNILEINVFFNILYKMAIVVIPLILISVLTFERYLKVNNSLYESRKKYEMKSEDYKNKHDVILVSIQIAIVILFLAVVSNTPDIPPPAIPSVKE